MRLLKKKTKNGRYIAYLLIEHAVVLVDIGDVAFVIVVALPGELGFLINAAWNGKVESTNQCIEKETHTPC